MFNISVGGVLTGPLIGHPVVNLVAEILTTFQVCIMFTVKRKEKLAGCRVAAPWGYVVIHVA